MTVKNILILFISFSTFIGYSQKDDSVLFTIDNQPVYSSEFLRVYNKNLGIVTDESQKDIKNYLDLFINYKLKIKQAYDLKYDTIQSYKKELAQYKNQLMEPYLKDESVVENLVKEAYERSLYEINASHILIKLNPKNSKDTLASYNTILEARTKIIEGADFDKVAKEYSQDPSAQRNGGNLGYFSAFSMVYPFETNAYSTKVGEVSMPFKTNFGYHIVKINDKRKARGEVEAAHIMIKGDGEESKSKIDAIYNLLIDGADFKELAKTKSDDTYSAKKGGNLGRFGSGKMIKEFDDTVFLLQKIGDISKPFKTKYGWHIIKLINKFPVESFDKVKKSLTDKVKRGDRSKSVDFSIVHKLKKQYNIKINDKALKSFKKKDWKSKLKKLKKTLLTIEGEKINQKEFVNYLGKKEYSDKLFNAFKEQEILNYFKNDLVTNNQEFKNTYQEYKEGLLLFELLQKRIWNKSKDSLGIQNYYDNHKNKYLIKDKVQELEKVRGKVVNDYQEQLEKDWIEELRNTYAVKMNDKAIRKVLN